MATALAIPLFCASLAVTLAAARMFAQRLDRLGVRFGFSEALIGLLTAVAADGPELSSAVTALVKGANEASVGVIVGSNLFNIAAMIGVSGMLVGRVRVSRETLALEAAIALAVTLIACALLLRWLAPAAAGGLALVALVPYLALVLGGARLLGKLGGPERSRLARALDQRSSHGQPQPTSEDPTHHLLVLALLDIALIIAGSVGMVQAALTLGGRWHLSQAIIGVLVLAPLTSLPNAFTGVRLGLADRCSALLGETFNSNTINLGGGVIVPALFAPLAALSTSGKLDLVWLLAMTLLCIAVLARPNGMRRPGALLLIAVYAAFAAVHVARG
jgi:cation:H+ antiporter